MLTLALGESKCPPGNKSKQIRRTHRNPRVKTPEGKAVSSMNALKTGLSCRVRSPPLRKSRRVRSARRALLRRPPARRRSRLPVRRRDDLLHPAISAACAEPKRSSMTMSTRNVGSATRTFPSASLSRKIPKSSPSFSGAWTPTAARSIAPARLLLEVQAADRTAPAAQPEPENLPAPTPAKSEKINNRPLHPQLASFQYPLHAPGTSGRYPSTFTLKSPPLTPK